jgi:NADPH:quinone reductase-like Zn-dependent oxidoreductase
MPHPAIIGACVAGTVEQVGSNVDCLQPGDRVASYTAFYARKDHKDNRYGAFQKYSLSKSRTTVKVKREHPEIISSPLGLPQADFKRLLDR